MGLALLNNSLTQFSGKVEWNLSQRPENMNQKFTNHFLTNNPGNAFLKGGVHLDGLGS
jgi:hypothetical protein